ncbi:MAG: hypothetical protein ACE5G8_08545 [Anaerolineae bacterium]
MRAPLRRAPGLPRFIESLRVVEALDIGLVLPGHGEPFTNHRQVIQRQRERIQLRKTECLKLVQSGHSTADRILLKMYAHYPPEFRFAGLWMVVGYLDLLKAEGAVIKTEMGGVWHYRPA